MLHRTLRFLPALALAASISAVAHADCDGRREGAYFGAGFEENMINVGCWMVRYDGSTVIENSNGQPVTIEDFNFNDQVQATGCELSDFSLQADRIVLVTPGSDTTCNDTFDGIFFGVDPGTGWLIVTCWPFVIDSGTTYEDSNGAPLTLGDLEDNDELRVFACDDGVNWPPRADRVVKMVTGSNLASRADTTIAWSNSGASFYFATSTSDPAIVATGSGNPNPTVTLEIGKRYMFSYPAPASHPFTLISRGASSASDTPLLVQGGGVGSMESDAGVDWVDSGADFFFTVTPDLATAMGSDPGYRCNIHVSSMRGQITLVSPASVSGWMLY